LHSAADILGLLFDLLANLFEFVRYLETGSALREPGTLLNDKRAKARSDAMTFLCRTFYD
jgi:hypothetical protein